MLLHDGCFSEQTAMAINQCLHSWAKQEQKLPYLRLPPLTTRLSILTLSLKRASTAVGLSLGAYHLHILTTVMHVWLMSLQRQRSNGSNICHQTSALSAAIQAIDICNVQQAGMHG